MEKSRRKNSISRRIIWGIVAFALVLVVAFSVPVCYGFLLKTVRDDAKEANNYADIAAHAISGDKASEYAATGEKDEYYGEAEAVLEAFSGDAELARAYVFVPQEGDHIMYLWDTGYDGEIHDLGERETVSKETMGLIRDVCSGKADEEQYYMEDSATGNQLLCVMTPVRNSQNEPSAVVCIQRPAPDTKSIILQLLFIIVIVAAATSAIMMVITYRILRRMLIRPIGVLTEGAEKMVGNLEREDPISIEIKTNDEMETLADAFTKMDADMREYIKELSVITAEKERIGAELDLAAKIQSDMLPKLAPPFTGSEAFDLFASMTPAKEVGGDFYDFFMVDDRRIALVMADVSGKGIPAALVMMISKTHIKNNVKAGKSPAEALRSVNEAMLENNDAGLFVTVWLAVIDLETGRGVAANAGHEHPALRHSGGAYELVKYKHSPAVATMEGIRYVEHDFALEPGDSLFVYTDGVTEATDGDQQLFGEGRMIEALNRESDAAPRELLPAVKEAIDDFVGDAPQFDDITMLAFKYKARTV